MTRTSCSPNAMPPEGPTDITELPVAWSNGDREAPGHTLNSTALVNEADLKLHFFAVSAEAMRHILIDMARGRKRDRHGGDALHIPLNDALLLADDRAVESIALDDALNDLAKLDERKCRIVEMRYFGAWKRPPRCCKPPPPPSTVSGGGRAPGRSAA